MSHTYKNPKKIRPEQFFEHDIHILDDDTGVTYFDWKTISARCISPDPHHPAYGMSISEYIRRRAEFLDYDDSGKSQIVFRVPPVVAMGIIRLARKHHISPTRYISFILEYGLVTYRKDYHGTASVLNADLDDLFQKAETPQMLEVVGQCLKQTISLGSACKENKLFSPSLQDWMSGVIKSTAMELNCSQSDMAYVCILIGIRKDAEEFPMPKAYMDIVNQSVTKFNFELDMLKSRVQHLLTINI
jgi:hypothetical protein